MKLESVVAALADQVQTDLEANLLEACRLRLGHEVPIEQLQARVGLYSKPEGDYYYLDGVVLALVGPIEVMDTPAGMTASRLFIRYKADGSVQPTSANDEPMQYERDLKVIERCEQQIVEQGGRPSDVEFFGAMGQLARNRTEGDAA